MGEYYYIVNLTKHEFLHPHKLASGLKMWEILASAIPLRVLGFLISGYNRGSTVKGRWAGDNIIMVGDYDDKHPIYDLCVDPYDSDTSIELELEEINKNRKENNQPTVVKSDLFKDISDVVIADYNEYIELDEYKIDVKSSGWRSTVEETKTQEPNVKVKPDVVITTSADD